MIKKNRNIVSIGFIAAVVLLLGMTVLIIGCAKKDVPDEGKNAAVTETKVAGHDEEKKSEKHGIITLSIEMQKSSGIEVKPVAIEMLTAPLFATAVIEMNMDKAAKLSPPVTGKVVKIIISQGDRVKAGQAVAYLDSVELNQIWTDYVKAQGKLELARKNLQREEVLFQKTISPEKDVLKARQELGEAEADINFIQERFRIAGVDVAHFATTKSNGYVRPLVPITSPVSGIVIEKAVTQGEVVNPDKTLFLVADLSTLWVVIDIYEKDMSRLKVGTGAQVSITAFPDKIFKGKISYIADVVDEKTRTEKARVTVDNVAGLLKPGMFASVLMEVKNEAGERLFAVPEEAVQVDGAARYVFVQISPDKFKRRDVEIGRTFGKFIEILSGLKEGEVLAVKGAFILKSELKKGELEGDAH